AYVVDVVADSPAEKAGIKVDDIITEIDGEKVSDNVDGLGAIVGKKNAGSTISIKLWRDSKEQTISVNLSQS
ncbi:PDZ domain-containing protein, partial [Xanthomonas euvesicatoria]|uniref:PDZ domain-containing protein n=1 Tax=Xanthomonas euvesicatoria TaxID=456327 RepID=UPI0013DFD3B5